MAAAWAWAVVCALADDRPVIELPVTDLASVLRPAEEEAIATKVVDHRDATGVQVAVLTVRTTEGVPIERFALETAEAWGGGSTGRADGVLLVLAVDDRATRLEVGRDLEPLLTDGEAGVILDRVRGDLQAGRYGAATGQIVDAVVFETAATGPVDAWAGPLGAQVAPAYLGTFTLGGLLGALAGWSRRRAAFGLCLGAAVALVAVFFEGAGFWWAYPLVLLSAAFTGAVLAVVASWTRLGALVLAAILHLVVPIHVAVDLAAEPIPYPRGIDVLTLLEYHYKVAGFVLLLAAVVIPALAMLRPGAGYGSGGRCRTFSLWPRFGLTIPIGVQVEKPARRKIGGPAASRQSWKGGGGRWSLPWRKRRGPRFSGGGATSRW